MKFKKLLCMALLATFGMWAAQQAPQSNGNKKLRSDKPSVEQAFSRLKKRLPAPVCRIIYDFAASYALAHRMDGKSISAITCVKKDGKMLVAVVRRTPPKNEREAPLETIELLDPVSLTRCLQWESGSHYHVPSWLLAATSSGCLVSSAGGEAEIWDSNGKKIETVDGNESNRFRQFRSAGNIIAATRSVNHRKSWGIDGPTLRNKNQDQVRFYQVPGSVASLLAKDETCLVATNCGLWDLANPKQQLCDWRLDANDLVLDTNNENQLIVTSIPKNDAQDRIEQHDDKGVVLQKTPYPTSINTMARCGKGLIALGAADGTVRIWDSAAKKDITQPFKVCSDADDEFDRQVTAIAASEDGSLIVARTKNHVGVIRLLNAYDYASQESQEQQKKSDAAKN